MKMYNDGKPRYTGPKPWMNYEWLYHQYVELDRSTQEIADEFGCKQNTIQCWLLKHGIKKEIKTRKRKEVHQYQNKEYLYNEHIVKKRPISEIARENNVSEDTIRYQLEKHGIDHWRMRTPVHPVCHGNTIGKEQRRAKEAAPEASRKCPEKAHRNPLPQKPLKVQGQETSENFQRLWDPAFLPVGSPFLRFALYLKGFLCFPPVFLSAPGSHPGYTGSFQGVPPGFFLFSPWLLSPPFPILFSVL